MKKYLFLLCGFIATLSLNGMAFSETEYNDFKNYTAKEIFEQFDNLNWTADGANSQTIVYVIGAPWCPSTQIFYNERAPKFRDKYQFRWIMIGPSNSKEVLNDKLFAKDRNPQHLNQILSGQTIEGQDSIGAQIAFDANFETIEQFKSIYAAKYNSAMGFPEFIFFNGNDWEASRSLANIKAHPNSTSNTPLCAKIASGKIIEYNIPEGQIVTVARETVIYAYPSSKATRIYSYEPNIEVTPRQLVELEDKTRWFKFALHQHPGGYVSGGWAKFSDFKIIKQ